MCFITCLAINELICTARTGKPEDVLSMKAISCGVLPQILTRPSSDAASIDVISRFCTVDYSSEMIVMLHTRGVREI